MRRSLPNAGSPICSIARPAPFPMVRPCGFPWPSAVLTPSWRPVRTASCFWFASPLTSWGSAWPISPPIPSIPSSSASSTWPPLPPLPRLAPCRFLRLAPYLPLGNFPPAVGQEEKGHRRSPPFQLLLIFRQLIFPKSPQNKQFSCNIVENYVLRGFRDVFFNVVALG